MQFVVSSWHHYHCCYGHQSSGRQTIWATDKWATANWATHFVQLGDRSRNNWTTTMEVWMINDCRAGAIMWSPFSITHQTNLPHSSLECYEVAGLIDASQCSVNQTAQVPSCLSPTGFVAQMTVHQNFSFPTIEYLEKWYWNTALIGNHNYNDL